MSHAVERGVVSRALEEEEMLVLNKLSLLLEPSSSHHQSTAQIFVLWSSISQISVFLSHFVMHILV